MSKLLFLFVARATAIRDLALPFPRPTPAQAVEHLATAVDAIPKDAPSDALDAYGGRSEWLSGFEAEIANYLGMESAVFFPTGVAAQNSALAVHANLPFRAYRTEPNPVFILHDTSHLQRYEEKAYSELLGLNALIAGEPHRILTADDIAFHLKRLAAVGTAPCMILVELPHRELGCETLEWSELERMRALADEYNVPLHLDGARLWEIAPYYQRTASKSIKDVVALFDSCYVSFYKGLGALTGAMLLGPTSFVEKAKPWRRRLGANPYTVMPYALSCQHSFRSHQGTFDARWQKLKGLVPLLMEAAEREGCCFRTVPEVPQCCQVYACIAAPEGVGAAAAGTTEAAGDDAVVAAMEAARDAVDAQLGRRVFNRLIGPLPPRVGERDDDASESGGGSEAGGPRLEERCFEWCLGPAHVELDDAAFVEAWAAFFRALRERRGV